MGHPLHSISATVAAGASTLDLAPWQQTAESATYRIEGIQVGVHKSATLIFLEPYLGDPDTTR